jgi:hypothetical protein
VVRVPGISLAGLLGARCSRLCDQMKKSAPYLPKDFDFGDPTEMNYEREAIRLAEAYPIRACLATESKIQAVHKVVAAWLDLEEKLKAKTNK